MPQSSYGEGLVCYISMRNSCIRKNFSQKINQVNLFFACAYGYSMRKKARREGPAWNILSASAGKI